jgi:hypothetical protein
MIPVHIITAESGNEKYYYNFSINAFIKVASFIDIDISEFDAIDRNYELPEIKRQAALQGLSNVHSDIIDIDIDDQPNNVLTIVQNLIPHALHLLNAITASNKAATAAQTRTKIAISVLPYIVAAGEDPKDAAVRAYEYADAFINLENTTHE